MRPSALVLTDGRAGNVRQASALAEAMGLQAEAAVVRFPWPWSLTAPHLTFGAYGAMQPSLRALITQTGPELVIGCGRTAALATRVLRRRAGLAAVQILDPRVDPRCWDLVIAPAHDRLQGTNVINTLGALNPITPEVLGRAAAIFPELDAHAQPRTLVAIGGSNRAQRIDRAYIEALVAELARMHAEDAGSFFITLSRRTDPALLAPLRLLAQGRDVVVYDPADASLANPYLGFLAYADRIVVTPDSVNLISEACATGKPVYCFANQPIGGKLAAFHRELMATDRLRPLARRAHAWQPIPLQETARVAGETWARLGARFTASRGG